MVIIDTNVVSELMRSPADPAVMLWIRRTSSVAVFTTAITQAEILFGIGLVPRDKRHDALARAAKTALETYFHGRILPFDSQAAVAYALIVVERRRAGRPISGPDAQIAAIARSRGADLATRNVDEDDFTGCGLMVINPWTATRH